MPNGKKQALAKYIKKFMAKGYSEEVLKSYLKRKGYSDSAINSSMKIAEKTKIRFPKLNKEVYAILGVIAVIVIAVIVLSFIPFGQGCGYDKQCFINAANNCESTVLREDLEGSTILYRSTEDCAVIKEFEEFSGSEPAEIQLLFADKEMACTYEKNNLNEDFVSLVGGIEYCDGELKDSIYELRLAQIALS